MSGWQEALVFLLGRPSFYKVWEQVLVFINFLKQQATNALINQSIHRTQRRVQVSNLARSLTKMQRWASQRMSIPKLHDCQAGPMP